MNCLDRMVMWSTGFPRMIASKLAAIIWFVTFTNNHVIKLINFLCLKTFQGNKDRHLTDSRNVLRAEERRRGCKDGTV